MYGWQGQSLDPEIAKQTGGKSRSSQRAFVLRPPSHVHHRSLLGKSHWRPLHASSSAAPRHTMPLVYQHSTGAPRIQSARTMGSE